MRSFFWKKMIDTSELILKRDLLPENFSNNTLMRYNNATAISSLYQLLLVISQSTWCHANHKRFTMFVKLLHFRIAAYAQLIVIMLFFSPDSLHFFRILQKKSLTSHSGGERIVYKSSISSWKCLVSHRRIWFACVTDNFTRFPYAIDPIHAMD